MKILHVNAFDRGGAANASLYLMDGLSRLGHHSSLLVGRKFSSRPDVHSMPTDPSPLLFSLRRRFFNALGLPEWRFRGRTAALLSHPLFLEADIVHLHNIHGSYFDFRLLPELSRRKPVVWSMHDMGALTGHCAYSFTCSRWIDGCGLCPLYLDPTLCEPPPIGIDSTAWRWKAKRKAYASSRFRLIAGCEWMVDLARRSELTRDVGVSVVPYGVDLHVFRPVDRAIARDELGLPRDATILLCFPSPGRKGMEILARVLLNLPRRDKTMILAVGGPPLPQALGERFPVHRAETIHDDSRLNLHYCAADLFLFPTLADCVPLSLVSAIAAGTPCVSFAVGGVPTILPHDECGHMAAAGNEQDFLGGIVRLMEDAGRRAEMAQSARAHAERHFDLRESARAHAALYEQVIRR